MLLALYRDHEEPLTLRQYRSLFLHFLGLQVSVWLALNRSSYSDPASRSRVEVTPRRLCAPVRESMTMPNHSPSTARRYSRFAKNDHDFVKYARAMVSRGWPGASSAVGSQLARPSHCWMSNASNSEMPYREWLGRHNSSLRTISDLLFTWISLGLLTRCTTS